MMLLINYLGGAKIKFRKWADYSCRNQVSKQTIGGALASSYFNH